MRNFWIGALVGIVVLALAGFCYVRFGFVDSRADIPVGGLEERIAMPALDASVDRHAPEMKNPAEPSDSNLTAGMKIYQADCASCHGDVNNPNGALADALYPRAPQFEQDSPDMPENQNFYIIQHGIRLSGMPAWKQSLSDQEIWQVTTFLSHMDKLPPQIAELWKATAGASIEGNPSPHPPTGMKMPMK